MTRYTVLRDGKPPLRFRGEELGFASSRRDARQRWFEVTIYRTSDDRYVVAGVGASEVENESDIHWVAVCDDPADVVRTLERDQLKCSQCGSTHVRAGRPCSECHGEDLEPSGERYLTRTAQEALEQASARDARIDEVYVVQI